MARWIHLATRLGYIEKFAFLQDLLYRTAEENKVSWLFLPPSFPRGRHLQAVNPGPTI